MAGTTEREKNLIKQYLTESGSFDNTGTPVMQDNYFDAIVSLKELCDTLGGDVGDMHDEVTLSADDTTQETLSLTDQELTVSLATTSTDGVMSAADKTKLDGIEAGAEVNPTFKTVNGESITGVGNIVTSETIDLDDVTGTLDDIDDGVTYVKSENNFTDALKTKLDGIEAGAEVNPDFKTVNGNTITGSGDIEIAEFAPSIVYDSVTTSTITNGVDGWSIHSSTVLTEGFFLISITAFAGSTTTEYFLGFNMGTTTKRGPITLSSTASGTKEFSITNFLVVEPGDNLTFNLMKKGASINISSVQIVKLA